MANAKKAASKTKDTVSKVLSQAKESLKVLEALEKETIAQIKNVKNNIKLPSAEERKKLTNDKIVSSLKKLGIATQSEVEELKARIATLEKSAPNA